MNKIKKYESLSESKLLSVKPYDIIECTDKNVPLKVQLYHPKPYDYYFTYAVRNTVRYTSFTLSDLKKINKKFEKDHFDVVLNEYYRLVPYLSKECINRILKTLSVGGFKEYLD